MSEGQIRYFFPFHQSLVRSGPDLQVSNVRTCRAYVPPGMYRCQTDSLETMLSDSLAVARLAQRLQPAHDIFDPRLYHFRILGILCQRTVAFHHRNQ